MTAPRRNEVIPILLTPRLVFGLAYVEQRLRRIKASELDDVPPAPSREPSTSRE